MIASGRGALPLYYDRQPLVRHVKTWADRRCRGADAPQSLGVEVRSQFLIRYVLACLSENGSQGAGIEFPVTRNRQHLFLSVRANAPQLDMAACLSVYDETKAFQDLNDSGS